MTTVPSYAVSAHDAEQPSTFAPNVVSTVGTDHTEIGTSAPVHQANVMVVPIQESTDKDSFLLCRPSKKRTLLIGTFLAVLLISVALAIVLGGKSGGDANNGGSPTKSASTTDLQERFTVFRNDLALKSDPSAFFDPNSPQSQALQWLVNQDQTISIDNLDRLTQRYVILVLYYSCGGENWRGYITPIAQEVATNECDLEDFGCNSEGTLVSIHLTLQEMNGRLPAELGLLTDLISLDFSNNDIEGPIPSALYDLTNLVVLDLGANKLTSTIAPAISNLSKLQFFRLSQNRLSGSLPTTISGLSNLHDFVVKANDLDGPVTSYLGYWPKLQTIDVRQTSLTGTIPTTLALMTELQRFQASQALLDGTIPTEIGLLSNTLKVFTVGAPNLSGSIPSAIGSLTLLVGLALISPNMDGTLPTTLGLLTHLTSLSLGESGFFGPLPTELGNLSRLSNLRFEGSLLTGTVPTELGKLTGLLWLNVARTELKGNIPDSVCETGSEIFFSCDLTCECCLYDCFGCPNTPQGCTKNSPSASPV